MGSVSSFALGSKFKIQRAVGREMQEKDNPMRLHSRILVLLINCTVFAVLIVIAEYGLRVAGFYYTRKPDPLVLEDTFQVNDRGLFTANPASAIYRQSGIEINHHGFRSPEFRPQPYASKRKTSVAIIGD